MRHAHVPCLLLLAGCDRVFGLQITESQALDAAEVDARLAIGHDEDLDTIDDAFDVCPNVADDQLDSDKDGVGDACDPHPGLPIDRLRVFRDFRDFEGWTAVTGSWAPGADVVTQSALSGNFLATLDLGELNDPTMIAVITGAASGSSFFDVGVYLITGGGLEPGLPAGLACYVVLPAGRLYSWDNRTPGAAVSVAAVDNISGYPLRVTLRASSAGTTPSSGPPSCSVLDPAGQGESILPTAAPLTSATAGLYTYNGSATFGSLVIIDHIP